MYNIMETWYDKSGDGEFYYEAMSELDARTLIQSRVVHRIIETERTIVILFGDVGSMKNLAWYIAK